VAYGLFTWFTGLFPGYLPKIGGLWSAISAIVVTQATSSLDPKLSPGLNALLRFAESCTASTGVAVLAVLVWPSSRRQIE
jgi:hypothetical protein